MNLYLVRHGEAAAKWGEHSDPGLSELGESQAANACQLLLDRLTGGARLYSSPLARARETAEPLSAALEQQPLIDNRIREIPAPVPLPERQNWLRGFMQQRWDQQPDSLHQWRRSALDMMLEQTGDAVFFTHFLVINAIVGRVLEHPDTLYFWPDNGSVTHLRIHNEQLEVVELGHDMKTVVN